MTGDSDRFRGSNRFRDSGRIKMIMVWGLRIQLRNDTSHGHHLPKDSIYYVWVNVDWVVSGMLKFTYLCRYR